MLTSGRLTNRGPPRPGRPSTRQPAIWTRNAGCEPAGSAWPGGSETASPSPCSGGPAATGSGARSGAADDPEAMATVAGCGRPGVPCRRRGRSRRGRPGSTVSVTVTSGLGHVPAVGHRDQGGRGSRSGGTIVGVGPGRSTAGRRRRSTTCPPRRTGPPAGVSPTAVTTRRWKATRAGGGGQGGSRGAEGRATRAARWPPGPAPTPRGGAGTGGAGPRPTARRARNAVVGPLEGPALGGHLGGGLRRPRSGWSGPVARRGRGPGDRQRLTSRAAGRPWSGARRWRWPAASITRVKRGPRSPDGRAARQVLPPGSPARRWRARRRRALLEDAPGRVGERPALVRVGAPAMRVDSWARCGWTPARPGRPARRSRRSVAVR